MTPDPSVRRPGWHLGPKHLLFAALGLMALFVIYNNERFIVDHSDPQWTYYFQVRWLLLVHGLTGAAALCLGVTQFSTRLRRRHVRVHRALGRSYVTAVAISAPLGIWVTILRNELPLRVAVITQALLWFLPGGVFSALGVALRRVVWMVRACRPLFSWPAGP